MFQYVPQNLKDRNVFLSDEIVSIRFVRGLVNLRSLVRLVLTNGEEF